MGEHKQYLRKIEQRGAVYKHGHGLVRGRAGIWLKSIQWRGNSLTNQLRDPSA